jgi:hypothetical protein
VIGRFLLVARRVNRLGQQVLKTAENQLRQRRLPSGSSLPLTGGASMRGGTNKQ